MQRSLYRQTLQTLAKSEKVKIWQNLGVPRSGQFDYKPRCGQGQFWAFGQLWPFKRASARAKNGLFRQALGFYEAQS